jgi:hypothetical protein
MNRLKLWILVFFVSGTTSAQNINEVSLFDNLLNQFPNVRDFCISKNGNEAFFTVQSPDSKISQIAYLKKVNNRWTDPELLPFNDSDMYMEPFLTDDGKRLFFASDRPLNDSSAKNFDIWYVEREIIDQNRWSDPINPGSPVNSEYDEFYPTLSKNGNLYFTKESPNGMGKDDIYFCKWDGKSYAKPELLSDEINSDGYEFNAFISKDENFLLYTKYNTKDGYGSGDLYLAKKDAEGNWQQAENLGNTINTPYMEYCPFYDEENKVLYFTSKRNSLSSKNFNTINELRDYISGKENGMSKIYSIKLDIR